MPDISGAATASRDRLDRDWASSILRESAEAGTATAWKVPQAGDSLAATRLAQSQALTGTTRGIDSGSAGSARMPKLDSYLSVRRVDLKTKNAPTARMPQWSRPIAVQEVEEDRRKVFVGIVPSGTGRVSVSRMNPDGDAGSAVVPPPLVVKSVYPPKPVVVNQAPPVSSTKPALAAQQVSPPALPSFMPAGKAAVKPAPASQPARTSQEAPAQAKKPPAKPSLSSAFMAKKKPAPVEDVPMMPEPPPRQADNTGVPISPDSQGGMLSEMVVVSPAGKTIRMTDYLRAKKLLEEADYISAEKMARAWIEKYPEDWRAWQLLGNIQVELKAYDQAMSSFRKSLGIHRDNPALRHYVNQAEGIEE